MLQASHTRSTDKEETVDLLQILILLVIAGICAAIAQWIVGFSPGGFIISIIVGVVGAYLGTSFAGLLAIPALLPIHVGTYRFDLVWAVLGSLLLLVLLYLIRYGSGPRLSARR
jgi:uncharacterized membrane protein YeaQ/YmgE (transglycosylase-associated protein family)